MRLVRTLAGTLLLIIGLPAALTGPGLAAGVRPFLPAPLPGPVGWALLVAGSVLVGLGIATLAWPHRPREVVFVVGPEQVPVLAARLGVPTVTGAPGRTPQCGGELAAGNGLPGQPTRLRSVPGDSRPETLADGAAVRPPDPAGLDWPPRGPAPVRLALTGTPVG
ncbi:MAG TPA: hypothetical protein VGD43_08710, partial [Micromonospora sp.]